jgi:hypothetical protein
MFARVCYSVVIRIVARPVALWPMSFLACGDALYISVEITKNLDRYRLRFAYRVVTTRVLEFGITRSVTI